jgi:hypothetical protein
VAEHDFALPYKRQTDSRLALLTGLSRKDVAQLRGAAPGTAGVEVEDNVVTHVLGRWMAGPPYATPDGVPRLLRYDADPPKAPSFTRLVRELRRDVPVRAVLDELLRIDSVELLPDGMVGLKREGHIVAGDVPSQLALLGSDPAELFSAIVHNIEQPGRPWLQRKVVYDNVGSDALAQLESEARRLGEEFIRRANALLSSYDRDRQSDAPAGTRRRVVLGAYYFAEPRGEDDAPSPHDEKRPPARAPGRIRRSK